MSVIRVKKGRRKPYVMLYTTALNDSRLSFRAKGLHTYLMSKPDDWQVYVEQLEKESPKEGRDAIRAALSELEQAGYITREKIRGARGRMAGWSTTIYETMDLAREAGQNVIANGEHIGLSHTDAPTTDCPTSVQPTSVQPTSVQPTSANPQLLSIDLNQGLKEVRIDSSPPPAPPQGGTPVALKQAKAPQRRKTGMPVKPCEQERLRQAVIDATLFDWYASKELTLDLSEQWEAFVRKALAKDYRYLDWRSAFMNWLTSPYQQQRARASPNNRISAKGERSAEAAKRIIEEVNHGTQRYPALP